jgi:hypothetical protein
MTTRRAKRTGSRPAPPPARRGAERARRPVKPPRNPLPIILAAAGVLALGIVGVVLALQKKAPPPKGKEPVVVEREVARENTGPIMFVCPGTGTHDDQEILIRDCSACGNRTSFFRDDEADGFACYACRRIYDNARIKCPDCGTVPKKVRIKITR